jgi:hypothetical protein
MSNNIVASVTRSGAYEPFDLQVSRGQILGHSTLSLFGYQTSVTTTSIPVWENAAAYTYPTSASTLTVVSTSATDVSPAKVLISGLDSNFDPISETVTLTGTSGVTTTNSYLRVNSLLMTGVASGQTSNVGVITAKQSSNTLAQINAGIGKSQSTVYTVPNGYQFYLDLVEVNTSNSYGSATLITYKVVTKNNTTGVTLTVLQQPFIATYNVDRSSTPFLYDQKTDIQWQLGTNTGTIAAGIIVAGKLIQANNNVTGSGT